MADLFWIFFILVSLQPVFRQRLLEASRQRMIARVEKERGSRVILLVHRQESMGFLGFPMFRFIDVNDSEEVLRACHLTHPDTPIDLILHTPGGLVLAALQIARAIRKHPGRVTVFVPHYAMSGGTMIALAADEIVMSEHAVLGPLDPQLGQVPAASVLRVVEQKPVEKIDDETLILADQGRKAIRQLQKAVADLLDDSWPEEKRQEVAKMLTEGRWTHDHPITPEDARELGLRVSTDIPEPVMTLMGMYPQPVRRQPSVEYLPIPRHAPERPSGGSS